MSKGVKLLVAAIFILLLNVGLFSFSSISLTSFWISWVFIHIAFVILVCVVVLSAPIQKKLIFGFSETAITTYYFIIELAAGLVLMFQFALFPVIAFVVQTIILAGFVLVFRATKTMNKNIEREENVRSVELFHFKSLLEAMKDVQVHIEYTAPYKKQVAHAYDAMAASPVKSSIEAREIEQYMLELIRQLKTAVIAKNEKEILDICQKIEEAVAKRNRELRLGKV